MHESTSRRSWLQTSFATFFGLLALRISPASAAPIANLPRTKPMRDPAAPDTVSYEYGGAPNGKVTEYTYDDHGRLTKVTEGPGTVSYFYYDLPQ